MVRRWAIIKLNFYTHWRMDSSSGHLMWTYIYPMRCVVCMADANFVTSGRDWGRHICTNTPRRKNLPIASSRSGIRKTPCLSWYCLLWNKNEITLPTQGNGTWRPTVLGTFLARTQGTGKSCWRTRVQPHKLIHKEQSEKVR